MMRSDSLLSLPDDPESMEDTGMSFDELPIMAPASHGSGGGGDSLSSSGSGTSATGTSTNSSRSGSSSPATPSSPLQNPAAPSSNSTTSATAKQSKFLRQRKESQPEQQQFNSLTGIDETTIDSAADLRQSQIMNQFLSLNHPSSSGQLYHGVAAEDIDLPLRKESDFDVEKFLMEQQQQQQQKSKRTTTNNNRLYHHKKTKKNTVTDNFVQTKTSALGTRRNWDQIQTHFLLELRMLRRDSLFLFFALVYQWVHSVFTNVAYYYHTQLSAAQRVPLMDVGFEALPLLTGSMWMISEYMVWSIVAIVVSCMLLILVVRMYPPHGRPLYAVPILRRMGMTLVVCQTLRIISFLVTTLPGAARQCMYHVPEDMTRDEMMTGSAPDRGQPEGWAPPQDWNDILWRIDATNGCGDLMFSSHTIFTMMFVCITFTYFNWRPLKYLMAIFQLAIVPFILAAHKHYSVDVFTALYVTPLVFEMLRLKLPDLDIKSSTMSSHYQIRFYLTRAGSYVVSVWGKEYYVDPQDLPVDLQQAHYGASAKRQSSAPQSSGGGIIPLRVKPSKSIDEHDTLSPSEVSAMIV
eukprot:CAMPEP_0195283414 /NCGR_PEP_ID=MMETSP0707-20130614/1968_1 /TAXON_ID=33640 /ORGANISM="Asterionellopsis glacialis, Strain CCMP134" /LENGTH=576 /DNA_ID=CAMNT_0040342577 /DNA_START=293 /DNA_END=2023 /DNA_ORIENTATION=+